MYDLQFKKRQFPNGFTFYLLVFFPHVCSIAGKWYVVAYVNETNQVEREEKCVKHIFHYNPEPKNFINESRTFTWTTTGQRVTNYFEFTFAVPGLVNATYDNNGTTNNYLLRVLQYTRGDSFIFSYCRTINGTLYTDRLVLFMTKQHVSVRTIRQKFSSVGIPLNDVNVLFVIQQNNCSYGL